MGLSIVFSFSRAWTKDILIIDSGIYENNEIANKTILSASNDL